MSHSHFFITGQLSFSSRKILLISGDTSYFVRLRSLSSHYVHGDIVRARIMKRGDTYHLAEVDILSLVRRTGEQLLGHFISKQNQIFFEILSEQGYYQKRYNHIPLGYTLGDIIVSRFDQKGDIVFLSTFGSESNFDIEERILFYLARVKTDFDSSVIEAGKDGERKQVLGGNRRDFSDWFTFTIDGADAKDLDDAISIKKNEKGNYLLAVHIADVAEYVEENSILDKEAYHRATSIYTPGKVIPMLPESLSNHLCSLHPGTQKFTLTCIMEINAQGNVLHTDIVESVITSQHRGIYEDIQRQYESLIESKKIETELDQAIMLGYELYTLLYKRRQKEGKILFESTELSFQFDENQEQKVHTPTKVQRRIRTDAHKLIEEFMIIANEEVAKWCEKNALPFLSRIHGLPGFEQLEIIGEVIRTSLGTGVKTGEIQKKSKKSIEPSYIRNFLDTVTDDDELYRLSRLLLPKMAKAQYSDKRYRHFGLALEYYAHFTSPIRRYPDLQVHRIIKEKLHNTLTGQRSAHYKNLLKKVARHCSFQERNAEDIERVFDSLYACGYMKERVGETYTGRIAGVTEFAVFVELESGIEGTLYLSRGRYRVNQILGYLETQEGKILYRIGEKMNVKIASVDMKEKRILIEKHH